MTATLRRGGKLHDLLCHAAVDDVALAGYIDDGGHRVEADVAVGEFEPSLWRASRAPESLEKSERALAEPLERELLRARRERFLASLARLEDAIDCAHLLAVLRERHPFDRLRDPRRPLGVVWKVFRRVGVLLAHFLTATIEASLAMRLAAIS
jgi:hypothetical protein